MKCIRCIINASLWKGDNPFEVAVFCEAHHKKTFSINLLNTIGNFRNPQRPGSFSIK